MDNDCDGRIDNDVTDADIGKVCGSTIGVCKPGITRCAGGAKFCEGGVLPEAEICNGLDDNCDGQVDNGINPPGPCPPPGLPPGSPAVGDCRPGMNSCVAIPGGGAAWMCRGGTGPAPELCDGRDNDCDGRVDNGATCPAGQGCADGECVPTCSKGEFACPADRVCVNNLCVYSECAKHACPEALSCDPKLGCVDRCQDVDCPEGTVCDHGNCTSCFVTGCPDGQVCRGARCEPNSCAGKKCPAGTYCSAGNCLKDCDLVRCAPGQSCHAGQCAPDRCAGVSCPREQACNPATGKCVINACELIQCLRGQVCVPQLAECVPDPCPLTVCAATDACVLTTDGRGECVDRRLLGANQRVFVSVSGGGCGCRLGGDGRGGVPGGVALALGALATVLLRRRRPRR
jgi:hypothetical protein